MQMKRAVGRDGAARKYDLLTILGVHALSQDKAMQRQVLRLICLITARYNWQHDQLSVGQTEIARMWSVDLRTVKREMAALRSRGWLIERRAAARGRVAVYGLGIARILEDTRPSWANVGEDLLGRLGGPEAVSPPPAGAQEQRKVIPFPQANLPGEDSAWGRAARRLLADDDSIFNAWFRTLRAEQSGDELILHAPSGFHAAYVQTHLTGRIVAALLAAGDNLRLRIC
jgi:hypothetical protein